MIPLDAVELIVDYAQDIIQMEILHVQDTEDLTYCAIKRGHDNHDHSSHDHDGTEHK